MRALATCSLLVVSSLAAAARADVLVVGGPAPDHATIQEAVQQAAEGDVVLVWPGSYATFGIFGKSLTVAARDPGVSITGMVRVQDLGADQRVALIGLDVAGNGEHALRLADCAGAVRVAGGSYRAAAVQASAFDPINDGVLVTDCQDVAISAATLVGGDGRDGIGAGEAPIDGGAGLRAVGGWTVLHDCALQGGDGGDEFSTFNSFVHDGGRGGPGAKQSGGRLLASGTTFRGGDGGRGGDETGCDKIFGFPAGMGGRGGDGLHLANDQALGPARGDLIDCPTFAGSGGPGGMVFQCSTGGAHGLRGQPVRVDSGCVLTQPPWAARSLEAPGTWRAGSAATLTFRGEPGDEVVLLRSAQPGFLLDPAKKGVLLLGGLPQIQLVGAIGPSGVLAPSIPAPSAPPGFEGRAVHLQAWMVSPTTGAHLTGAAPVVVLHPSL